MSNRNAKGQFVKGVILNDLTGKNFGNLTVIRPMPKTTKKTYFECQCKCGNIKVIRSDSLTSGRTVSCGCLKIEQDKINLTKNHSHKKSRTRIYNEWLGMKARCYNKAGSNFERYGGRGIAVCDEWKNDFQAFHDWAMENGYSDELSIDRIDVNGNYEPSNCRWTDNYNQCRNRRSNIYVEYYGQKMCLIDAARLSGINSTTIYYRYQRGDRGEDLFRPIEK